MVESPPGGGISANNGTAFRFDDIVKLDLLAMGGRPALTLTRTRGQAIPPIVEEMERHRLSSQAFISLSGARFLVIVAPAGDSVDPDTIHVFRAAPGQGVNYHRGTWHHALLSLEDGDFAVIGRTSLEEDCDLFPVRVRIGAEL